MVIGEAMRTFTYLNLYGYLTDAVIVNRIFPSDVGEYFAAWRALQEEHLELVSSAFAPVPVLCAPYFDQEVVGAQMLDRLARELFGARDPAAILHTALTQQIEVLGSGARLRLELPFARKSEVSLKQAGLELIVGVDGQRRTISLPPALASLRASGATFEDGALEVSFDAERRTPASG
jgi:arsenite-transporting ATPase